MRDPYQKYFQLSASMWLSDYFQHHQHQYWPPVSHRLCCGVNHHLNSCIIMLGFMLCNMLHSVGEICDYMPPAWSNSTVAFYRTHIQPKHLCFPQETTLEQMVQQIEVTVGFVSKPKAIRDGQAAMCILRLPSAKEQSQRDKNKAADSSSRAARNKSVGVADTTEGPTQPWAGGIKHFHNKSLCLNVTALV